MSASSSSSSKLQDLLSAVGPTFISGTKNTFNYKGQKYEIVRGGSAGLAPQYSHEPVNAEFSIYPYSDGFTGGRLYYVCKDSCQQNAPLVPPYDRKFIRELLAQATKELSSSSNTHSFDFKNKTYQVACKGAVGPEYQIGNSIASFDNPNFNRMPGGADRCYVCKDKCLTNSELSGKNNPPVIVEKPAGYKQEIPSLGLGAKIR